MWGGELVVSRYVLDLMGVRMSGCVGVGGVWEWVGYELVVRRWDLGELCVKGLAVVD